MKCLSLIRRLNVDFLFLFILVFWVNIPFLSKEFIPIHDTFQTFQVFYYFYNQFFFTNEIPHWNLNGIFGLPTGMQHLVYITPAGYLLMLTGNVFNIQNVMLLFKLSILFNQLILLAGLYKLSGLLYQNRATVIFVCAGFVCSMVCYSQIFFNFRLFYTVPFILYFLILFCRTSRPRHFWSAAIIYLASMHGNLFYFSIIWLVLSFAVLLFLSWNRWHIFRALLSRSASNVIPFSIVVFLTLLYIGFLLLLTQDLTINVPGRDPVSGKISIENFLSYGGRVNPLDLMRMFLFGWPTHTYWSGALDNSVYIGLLPLPLFFYAVLKVRDRIFLSFLAIFVFLVWFSSAGVLSGLLFHVPGFSFVRHLGLYCGLGKIFIVLCAGFGLNAFIREGKRVHVLTAFILFLFLFDFLDSGNKWWQQDLFWSRIFCIRILTYSALLLVPAFIGIIQWAGKALLPHSGPVFRVWHTVISMLIVSYLCDMLLFQLVVSETAPKHFLNPVRYTEIFHVSPPEFQMERRENPRFDRSKHALKLAASLPETTANATIYNFAQHDPSFSKFIRPCSLNEFELLLETLRGRSDFNTAGLEILGCESPKFRLLSDVIFVDSIDEALNSIRHTGKIGQTLILRGVPQEKRARIDTAVYEAEPGTVHFRYATSNEVVVETRVDTHQPAWLVYADSFHPFWRATVNGKKSMIAEAYMAFKAVRVPGGKSIVKFTFTSNPITVLGNILAVVSLIFGLFMALLCLKQFIIYESVS